jgi:hypothetical protein
LGADSSIVETSSIAMLAAPIIALPSPSLWINAFGGTA